MTLAEFADTMPPPPPPSDELEAERRRANENAEAHFTALKQLQQVKAERDHVRAELVDALREAKLEARARAIALQERDVAIAERDKLIALARALEGDAWVNKLVGGR